jgi:hypothetical protein
MFQSARNGGAYVSKVMPSLVRPKENVWEVGYMTLSIIFLLKLWVDVEALNAIPIRSYSCL